MIGVATRADKRDIAREFFELFKTSWEFSRADERYEAVLDDGSDTPHQPAELVLVYGGHPTAFDQRRNSIVGPQRRNTTLAYNGERLPVYGSCVTFPSDGTAPHLALADSGESVVSVTRANGSVVIRIGYDLFSEIDFLLTTGQPPANAGIATLERHIAVLRDCILSSGLPLVEIPPIPAGYRFIVCLTHDVDHPSIRLHKFDHTMFGFLYRAVVGSLIDVCSRRTSPATLRRNVTAALMLPFVHLGWAKDFWSGFDQYLEIEHGLKSTFFVIPVKNHPGRTVDGEAPRMRASSYGVADIAHQLNTIVGAGCEVAVHGLDAWLDSVSGAEERETVSRATGTAAVGTRMHWLFWDDGASERLEKAGFSYDSTFGYNDAVGFRAGTAQAFKPITAKHLLEIPLTIMDTALFYPSHLHLTQRAAKETVRPLVDDAERYGGALTINWHDRSLAPERLWGGFYADFIDDLKRRDAWFPTTAQATAWFRRRRSAVFDSVGREGDSMRIAISADHSDDTPGLTVRVYAPSSPAPHGPITLGRPVKVTDLTFNGPLNARVAL